MNNNLSVAVAEDISRQDALLILERVLKSEPFVRSYRLSLFLRFTVERSLEGRSDLLKEYTIGTEVYGRRSDFDPAHDSIVRAEARRLRKKLNEYREREGQEDALAIVFRPGSYVPCFERTDTVPRPELRARAQARFENFETGRLFVQIKPFRSLGSVPHTDACALDITEELLHRMGQIADLNVVWCATGSSSDIGISKRCETPEGIVIEGSVRDGLGQLWITIRITAASGLLLTSQRFAVSTEGFDLAEVSEKLTAAVLNHIPAESEPQQRRRSGNRILANRNWSRRVSAFSAPLSTNWRTGGKENRV
jgi:TolB-like protein